MTLGQRIKKCRQQANLTQEQVAEAMGISRQAVTKWESGQSAPSTENLFKLAELFGTTVDLIIDDKPRKASSTAEELFHMQKEDALRQTDLRRKRWVRKLKYAALTAGWYLALFLLCRILCTTPGDYTVMGWLFGTSPYQTTYLFGWLLNNHLYLYSSLVSIAGALFGKEKFAGATTLAFTAGYIIGECFGEYPPGDPYGHGHYGWAIWACFFLAGIVMGTVLQILKKRNKAN